MSQSVTGAGLEEAVEKDGGEGAGAKKARTLTCGAATSPKSFKAKELIVPDRAPTSFFLHVLKYIMIVHVNVKL